MLFAYELSIFLLCTNMYVMRIMIVKLQPANVSQLSIIMTHSMFLGEHAIE